MFFIVGLSACGDWPLGSSKSSGDSSTGNEQKNSENQKNSKNNRQSQAGSYNIAVAPGGGLNAYTSLYLSKKFEQAAGKKIPELFDLYWGLSGGALAASLYMTGQGDKALENFKRDVDKAFPTKDSLITNAMPLLFGDQGQIDALKRLALDEDGQRRQAFEKALKANIGEKKFSDQGQDRFVFVASVDANPYCYGAPSIKLPQICCHRNAAGARVIDGIVNSSNFQLSVSSLLGGFANLIPRDITSLSLFKRQALTVAAKQVPIVDGFLIRKDLSDGNSPLPLVIDYLLQFKNQNNSEHNIVVFDNGSGSIADYKNQKFRDDIGIKNGYAQIKSGGVVINIYLLDMNVTRAQFDSWIFDQSDKHWADAEQMVDQSVSGSIKQLFDRAIDAVKKNM